MDIYNADLADVLTGLVRRHGLAPSRLHLEITESAYTDTSRQLIETLGALRRLGFVIEMDDFGSGYSSLNMLTEMPIDVLKLDMKFIQTEITRPTGQAVSYTHLDVYKRQTIDQLDMLNHDIRHKDLRWRTKALQFV